MAGQPQHRPGIREHRARRADGGEPLNSERRSVRYHGNSLVVGLTHFGVTLHQITEEDEVEVETHADGIWIPMYEGAER